METKKEIIINEISINVTNYTSEVTNNKPTGNTLQTIKFSTNIKGLSNHEKLVKLLEAPITFKIPSDNLEFRAKGKIGNWYYQNSLDENTIIKHDIEITELDQDLPEEWNALGAMYSNNIMNWIRTRALAELLIEKGILTMEEYDNKIKVVSDRDYENMDNLLMYGKKEPLNPFNKDIESDRKSKQ